MGEPGAGMGAGHQVCVWHKGPQVQGGHGPHRACVGAKLGAPDFPWMAETTQWGACTQGWYWWGEGHHSETWGKSVIKGTTCLGPGPCGKPTAEVAFPVWCVIRGLGSGLDWAVGWAQMGGGGLPTGGRPAPLAIAPHEVHGASGPSPRKAHPAVLPNTPPTLTAATPLPTSLLAALLLGTCPFPEAWRPRDPAAPSSPLCWFCSLPREHPDPFPGTCWLPSLLTADQRPPVLLCVTFWTLPPIWPGSSNTALNSAALVWAGPLQGGGPLRPGPRHKHCLSWTTFSRKFCHCSQDPLTSALPRGCWWLA